MSKEKVENEKSIRRRRKVSMATYEMKRQLMALLPSKQRKTTNSGNRFQRKQIIFVWKMLAIPILQFLVFWVYVNFDSILLAFRNIDYAGGGREYWTLKNFKEVVRLFKEGDMLHYGLNTLMFWLLSTAWAIPHSVLLTYAFHKKMAGSKVFRLMLYIPDIMCAVALAGIFQAFINSDGALGYVLEEFLQVERVPSWFQEAEFATWMLLIYKFFFGFAGHYILFSGAMANIDTEITEAAYVDGVSMWQELFYIDIPLMWPTISMVIVTSFGALFGASGPILLFTHSLKSTWTFGYWIFDQVRVYQAYYIPAALGLCFTCIAFPVAMFVKKVVNNMFTTE